ncbi:hypothetical protein O181_059894 [Austropuccinia psidii MF-1]|uniref:Reverse transcriptase domain-containing protein n=1 Tax=Austropuccinia psidii MF-1 TaxID=1389203 RepID=A0A9Q3HZ29_9BASI|nr:hypothetical protein [Austropuccinia psidii MF-1]
MMKVVTSVYHQYLDVFSKIKAEKLPPHHACDHHIALEGSLPPVGVIHSLSKQESDTLRAYISENLEKCFIQPNSSATGAPVLFVKKKDGVLCLCVDYRKVNAVTRKNKYPVPAMNQLLNVFNGSSIFSKIDFHCAYNLLRIKEGDEHLTCFRTIYGSFEYLVMPFGLTNAPASFQNLVNDIFQDLLDVYVVLYLDDIMVFSKSEEEHVTHVSSVLSRLRANNLFAKNSKCLFHVSSVEYLGYVASPEGLKIDQENGQQILNWLPPRNLKALQSFLGFANLCRRFIKNYSKKIRSLTSLLKKDSCLPLNEKALGQFHHCSKPSLPTIVETNASNYALGAVLSQILTHQSDNPWRQSEDHSRIPITWPCRSWVGIFIGDYSKGIIRGYKVFQSVVKASSTSILLGQLNWSIQASINQPVCPWPNWGNSIFHCGNSITQFNFKMPRTVLAQFRQYSRWSTFQDQSFSFSHILATFQHLGTFSPVN